MCSFSSFWRRCTNNVLVGRICVTSCMDAQTTNCNPLLQTKLFIMLSPGNGWGQIMLPHLSFRHFVIPAFCHSVILHFPIIIATTVAHIQLKLNTRMCFINTQIKIWFRSNDFWQSYGSWTLRKWKFRFPSSISTTVANIKLRFYIWICLSNMHNIYLSWYRFNDF